MVWLLFYCVSVGGFICLGSERERGWRRGCLLFGDDDCDTIVGN